MTAAVQQERVMLVFRNPRGANILSVAVYPATKGGSVLAFWIGSREFVVRWPLAPRGW